MEVVWRLCGAEEVVGRLCGGAPPVAASGLLEGGRTAALASQGADTGQWKDYLHMNLTMAQGADTGQ